MKKFIFAILAVVLVIAIGLVVKACWNNGQLQRLLENSEFVYESAPIAVYRKDGLYVVTVEDTQKALKGIMFSPDRQVIRTYGIEPVEISDISPYLEKTWEELENDYGTFHMDIGSGLYLPSYITTEGYLVTFSFNRSGGTNTHVGKMDLFTGDSVEWYFANRTPVYQTLLEDYRSIVEFRLAEDVQTKMEQGQNYEISDILEKAITEEQAYFWGCMFVEMPMGLENPTLADFGYALKDVNGDRRPELFWLRSDGVILAAFSVLEERPVLLGAFWARHDASVSGEGYLLISGSGGWNTQSYQVLEILPDGTANILQDFGLDAGQAYETVDGEKRNIDQTRLAELIETHIHVELQDISREIKPLTP